MGLQYDLVGRRFGQLTVIAKENIRRKTYGTYGMWRCLCDCGNETVVITGNLMRGLTRSCGCAHKGRPASDLAGKRFGKLLVVERVENYYSPAGLPAAQWRCKCDCGNECVRTTGHLYNSRSCGCSVRVYLDGNKKNNADSNVRIVSRDVAAVLFRKKLISSDPKITDSAITKCELEAKLKANKT